jgi:outer membrane protein assembly factor BamA
VAFGMSARFNRVEGFTLLPNLNFEDNKNRLPKVSINSAYAFTLKRWEYDFGVEHRFGRGIMPYFNVHMFQLAKSSDSWRFDETENTVAGLFFKEDFWDFYWSRGFKGEAGLYFTDDFQVGALYEASRISNLERTAQKAIFGGKKKFRENWSTLLPDSVDILGMKGDLKEAGVKLGYDTRSDKTKPSQGGTVALVEWRKTTSASTFKYQLTTAEARTSLPIAANQVLILRVRGGYSDDNLPLFRRFFIGGIGSLRGYDYKEFEGNRYALFSGDYVWRFFHSDFGAGVFFDTGKAAQSSHQFSSSNPKSDIGISFLIEDAFRLDLAQRLDDLNRHPVVSARLELPL